MLDSVEKVEEEMGSTYPWLGVFNKGRKKKWRGGLEITSELSKMFSNLKMKESGTRAQK